MNDVRIRTTAIVREVLTERTCRAVLRNGKIILAYKEPRDAVPLPAAGDRCPVLLSLCDFGEGRIVPEGRYERWDDHPIIDGDAMFGDVC
jgi:hypothetical protein